MNLLTRVGRNLIETAQLEAFKRFPTKHYAPQTQLQRDARRETDVKRNAFMSGAEWQAQQLLRIVKDRTHEHGGTRRPCACALCSLARDLESDVAPKLGRPA